MNFSRERPKMGHQMFHAADSRLAGTLCEISKHLLQAKLPFTVDFTYLAKGIRIKGESFPVLKMQWVEGFLFNEFVRDNLTNPPCSTVGQIWGRMGRTPLRLTSPMQTYNTATSFWFWAEKKVPWPLNSSTMTACGFPHCAKEIGRIRPSGIPAPAPASRKPFISADVDKIPLLAIACALRALAVAGKPLWEKYDNGDNMLFREAESCTPRPRACLRGFGN